jgi:hypothetical protein
VWNEVPRKDERKKGWEEAVEGPGMQNWNKEPGHKNVAAPENQEDNKWLQQEGFRTIIREASKRHVQRVTEGETLDLVEGSAPSEARNQGPDTVEESPPETEKEIAHGVGGGNVGAQGTLANFDPTVGKENIWMLVMDMD